MSYKILHGETSSVILSIGDIIIDTIGGHIGMLIGRKKTLY